MPVDYANATTDLVSLIERESNIRLTRRANHYKFGPEFWGSCPFCGTGENRFHVWPHGERPHYWCRVCGAEGSPAWFLSKYCGKDYGEALQILGLEEAPREAPKPLVPHGDKSLPPSEKWQESGKNLVERAERYLWRQKSPEAHKALTYLRSRGLTDETIKKARIGYVPLMSDGRWFIGSFEDWGIDPDTLREEQRQKGGVRIPDGILIPWFTGDILWKIAFKRPGEKIMDYGQVMGSSEGLYNADALEIDKPAIMVEGEFDCLSIMQECGIACVATGSDKKARTARWITKLALASLVLQAFDEDEEDERGQKSGDVGAQFWLDALKHNCLRWSPGLIDAKWYYSVTEKAIQYRKRFKDANEVLQTIYNGDFAPSMLREWVEAGIYCAQVEFRPEPQPDPPVSPLQGDHSQSIEAPAIEAAEPIKEEVKSVLDPVVEAALCLFGGKAEVLPPTITFSQWLDLFPKPSYTPFTLPPLTRSRCPHMVIREARVSDKIRHPVSRVCGVPATENGWCQEHRHSYRLLEVGAQLGYPAVELGPLLKSGQGEATRPRGIIAGCQNWEAHAELVSAKHLQQDIAMLEHRLVR